MRETDFVRRLRALIAGPVNSLDELHKIAIVEALAAEIRADGAGAAAPDVHWVPFVAGHRPTDEAAYPGLGSSDHVAMILKEGSTGPNRCLLLYRVAREGRTPGDALTTSLTLSFAGPWGDLSTAPIPGWRSRELTPRTLHLADGGLLDVAGAAAADGRALVVEIVPEDVLLPGRHWTWTALDPAIRDMATDAEDPFTFGSLFSQRVRAELVLRRGGTAIAACEELFDVCDARRFGSLYRRVLERVVAPDAAAQAARHPQTHLEASYHPWFPVLLIGTEKADLYEHALIGDIVHKQRNLSEPRWLLRVGLYLEFLTCLGIFEAVRDDLGDLLTPAERRAYEGSPAFALIRTAVDPAAWREVWEHRHIVTPHVGTPHTGAVSGLNLLAKKKATLAFLKAHHEDLKQAIALAGPNETNAQETWHRVFRDAERAVIRRTPGAFPELDTLGTTARDFVLWHRKGSLSHLRVPPAFSGWFGDQDGLYVSAASQYRASMNHVASWARERGLMTYAGEECVPEGAGLLSAVMHGQRARFAQLQRRDGYEGAVEVERETAPAPSLPEGRVLELLAAVPLLGVLREDERAALAASVRPVELGPFERIIVQGLPGTSLFVLAQGSLEVLVRQADGHDLPLATLQEGAVFGEMSLLTGAPHSATVRAIDAAVVLEIGQPQLAPILAARPSVADDLGRLMEQRLRANAAASEAYGAEHGARSLAERVRAVFAPGA